MQWISEEISEGQIKQCISGGTSGNDLQWLQETQWSLQHKIQWGSYTVFQELA